MDEPYWRVNEHLVQWGRLVPITASVVMIQHHWAEIFLDWSQLSVWRVPSMQSTVICLWPLWAFKVEDIDSGLFWRGMGTTRFAFSRHDMHEWYLSGFLPRYVKKTGRMLSHAAFDPDMWRKLVTYSSVKLSTQICGRNWVTCSAMQQPYDPTQSWADDDNDIS